MQDAPNDAGGSKNQPAHPSAPASVPEETKASAGGSDETGQDGSASRSRASGETQRKRAGEADARTPRSKRSRRTPDRPCLNCGDTTVGSYCPSCGQAKREIAVSVRALLVDVLEDQLILSRALPRSLISLFFRPGHLTHEYTDGRIVRYIAPFRLYLAASVLFFLLLSLFGVRNLELGVTGSTSPEQARATVDSLASAALAAGADPDQIEGLTDQIAALSDLDVLAAMDLAVEGSDESENASEEVTDSKPPASALERLNALVVAPEGVQPWARDFYVSVGDSAEDERIERRIVERFGHMPLDQAIRAFLSEYLSYVPTMVFVMLPVFALVLKLLYLRRKRYYAEHFIFALHVHAFVFLMFALMLIPYEPLRLGILAWIPIYIWFALKRVYQQGIVKTTLKYGILGTTYLILLTAGLSVTVLVTFYLL